MVCLCVCDSLHLSLICEQLGKGGMLDGKQRRMMGSHGKLIISFIMFMLMVMMMSRRRSMDMVMREGIAMAIIEDESREGRGLTPIP
mgnify:CR=1 FL=1